MLPTLSTCKHHRSIVISISFSNRPIRWWIVKNDTIWIWRERNWNWNSEWASIYVSAVGGVWIPLRRRRRRRRWRKRRSVKHIVMLNQCGVCEWRIHHLCRAGHPNKDRSLLSGRKMRATKETPGGCLSHPSGCLPWCAGSPFLVAAIHQSPRYTTAVSCYILLFSNLPMSMQTTLIARLDLIK